MVLYFLVFHYDPLPSNMELVKGNVIDKYC